MIEFVLEVPEPIEVVSAPELAAQMELERVVVTELAARAASLRTTATELEVRAATERVDADTAGWMMLRLQQFLVEWREETEAEATAVIRGAELRAAQIRRRAQGIPLSLTGAFAARRSFPDVLPRLPEALIRWTPASVATPTPARVVVAEPVTVPTPVATRQPAVVEATAPVTPVASAASVVPLVDPLLASLSADIDLVADAAVSADSQEGEGDAREFWPEDARRGRRRRRVSAAVLLQVLAGTAAVAAVAVRFV